METTQHDPQANSPSPFEYALVASAKAKDAPVVPTGFIFGDNMVRFPATSHPKPFAAVSEDDYAPKIPGPSPQF